MDYNKIGLFIAEERKKKKLTQAKLAEKLFISEKTVSKWENGNGIPDTNSLVVLSEVLDISINELLNGERIVHENYEQKAEQKLIQLQREKETSFKRLLHIEIVLGVVAVVQFLALLFIAEYMIVNLSLITIPVVLIILATIIFFVAVSYCLYIEQIAGYYVCGKCGHKYVPSYDKILIAPHLGRTRYMKCPHCKKCSWSKKVIK